MPLAAGARLGPYEILDALGAGGMGEVYTARDPRLDRVVAIKVLSPAIGGDPVFRDRFQREARLVSQLEHPNICAVYDVGHESGVDYLVMQYLEGETLAERVYRGALPLRQALKIAIEVTRALDRAHRLGVVHRDLKPGNVMLTKSGAKLLDFGLAKTTSLALPDAATLRLASPLTTRGTILGTFQYMAPEQLEGREADTRSDIFAFGAVLFEMLTGTRAFGGSSPASVISAIMSSEPPPVSAVKPLTPRALDAIVRRCLAKDPDDRWQTAGDVGHQLEWISSDEASGQMPAVAPRRALRQRIVWALGAAALVLAAALAATLALRPGGPSTSVGAAARFELAAPAHASYYALQLETSPDGRHLAFPLTIGARRTLWVRPLDAVQPREIADTEDLDHPFWSNDSRRLGFFARGKLKVADIAGGPVTTVCDAVSSGAAWSGSTIIFGQPPRGIFQVSASGGTPAAVTNVDPTRGEQGHTWPQFLPGGRRFLFYGLHAEVARRGIYLASLDGSAPLLVQQNDSMGRYVPPGYLLFVRNGVLFARTFDPDNPLAPSEPVRLADSVAAHPANGRAAFSVTEAGVLAYRTIERLERRRLEWFDKSGTSLGALEGIPAGDYDALSLSPTSRYALLARGGGRGSGDIWVSDLQRGVLTRETFDEADDLMPLWSRDGRAFAFSSDRTGVFTLYRKAFSDGSQEQALGSLTGARIGASDWLPDGSGLIATVQDAAGTDIWVVPVTGGDKPRRIIAESAIERDGRLSPNGRWLAYTSSEKGQDAIYVQAYPPTGAKWVVSTGGGEPLWSADGRQLFYLGAEGRVMQVDVRPHATEFDAGSPRMLFQRPVASRALFGTRYAVSRDGRFLMVAPVEQVQSAPIIVLVNWTAALANGGAPAR